MQTKEKTIDRFKVEVFAGTVTIAYSNADIEIRASKFFGYKPNAFEYFDHIKSRADIQKFISTAHSYWAKVKEIEMKCACIGHVMLETPQERVKLLKAGIDGKTIEKLYIIYNNFKIASSPILFDMDKMQIHPPASKKKNKNDICWGGVKMFFLAYVCGTFSIILRSAFPNYSPLIILIASSILIYFIIWTIRKTDWNLLIYFLRKNITRYTA